MTNGVETNHKQDDRLDIFVASTPLQLISCTEAFHHYGCSKESSLLVLARLDNRETELQVEFLVDALGWKDIETVKLTKQKFYFKISSVLRRLAKRPVERMFVGNRSSWIQEIIYRGVDSPQCIFVDDGLATVRHYYDLQSHQESSRISKRKTVLLSALRVQLQARSSKSVEFFTCFPLESQGRMRVTHHDFPVFRERFRRCAQVAGRPPIVGFIGQPIGGENRLSRLRKQLEHVLERYQDTSIVYFMHRKESQRDLERMLSGLNVDIRQAGRPIEVEVALSGENYIAFYSFVSTALFTLKKIFPETNLLQIDDHVLGEGIPYYDEIISMLKDSGVESVKL